MATIPTISVYGPKGHLIVNVPELEMWKAKGYSTTKPADPKTEKEQSESKHDPKAELKALREKAASLGLPNAAKLKQEELVAAIAEIEKSRAESQPTQP